MPFGATPRRGDGRWRPSPPRRRGRGVGAGASFEGGCRLRVRRGVLEIRHPRSYRNATSRTGIAGPSMRPVTALTGDGWGDVRQIARALTTPRVEPWPSPAGPRVSGRARASTASWVRTFTAAAGPWESAGARRHPRQAWDSLDVSATGMASHVAGVPARARGAQSRRV